MTSKVRSMTQKSGKSGPDNIMLVFITNNVFMHLGQIGSGQVRSTGRAALPKSRSQVKGHLGQGHDIFRVGVRLINPRILKVSGLPNAANTLPTELRDGLSS